MSSIKYPVSILSNRDRYCYLYRLQELLRLEHNEKGTQFRNSEITEVEWNGYKNKSFDPLSDLISAEICKYRELLKKDSTSVAKLSDVDLDDAKE